MARNYNDISENNPKVAVTKNSLQHLLGIYKFMMPYKGWFIAGLFCLVFSSTILLAFPFFTGKLVDSSVGKAPTMPLPNPELLANNGFGGFLQNFDYSNINHIALVLLSILVFQSIFSFLRVFFFSRVSEKSMADIRKALYQKLMTLPMSFYDSRRIGEVMSRLTSDVALLQDTFSITLAEFVRQIATLIIGLSILFFRTPTLTFFMLGIVPVLVLAGLFFGKRIRKMSKETQDELAKANIVVEETLQAISMVKSFTNERFEVNRYKMSLDKVVSVALNTANYRGAFISFIVMSIFGGIVAVLWYGSKLVQTGEMSIGDLTGFIIYTMFIGGSIGGLGDLYGQLQRALGASERLREILEQPSEANLDKPDAPISAVAGNITFRNVQFAYPSRKDVGVLQGINLSIKSGEKVALVGHSGAGKSTIIQLLMRFYDLDGGEILLDNKNINSYDLVAYRHLLGIVPQEVILFGGTIKENIAYGKPNASEAEIIEAAQKANAYKFIQSFPEGLNTLVGERGVKLSGGQRQRIAIARAILKDPAVLILDEATSSLDAESEQAVKEALETLMKNRTTIIIAHRLATIRTADKIYVLDKGKIAETGTHEQLLGTDAGVYGSLVKLQMTEFARN
jgi:ABC-type multidrug transport system fused ATPase/permease subunit